MADSRINDLFTRALELGPAAREIFLAQACGDDAELHLEVQRMLVDAERADSMLGNDDSLMADINARLAAHAASGDLDATVPPSGPARRLAQGPPSKSKSLATGAAPSSPRNPLSPARWSDPMALSGASRRKQITAAERGDV